MKHFDCPLAAATREACGVVRQKEWFLDFRGAPHPVLLAVLSDLSHVRWAVLVLSHGLLDQTGFQTDVMEEVSQDLTHPCVVVHHLRFECSDNTVRPYRGKKACGCSSGGK